MYKWAVLTIRTRIFSSGNGTNCMGAFAEFLNHENVHTNYEQRGCYVSEDIDIERNEMLSNLGKIDHPQCIYLHSNKQILVIWRR